MPLEELIEPVLAVSDLYFSYPDRPDVLKGMNLKVMNGERVGVVGPNGSGKTTFFMAVCGVLKPSAGTVPAFRSPEAVPARRSEQSPGSPLPGGHGW